MGRKRFFGLLAILVVVTAGVVTLWMVQMKGRSSLPAVRALWVSRFEYQTPQDVSMIISNVNAAGFTDLFFQIRGNGTAYYDSQLEPWAFELSGDDVQGLGTDPGWDPLQHALNEAAGTGLRVHAYMNVLPGWKGLHDPPAAEGQLWTAHPDWFMVDSLGQKMLPTSGWYAFVNPVMSEVRSHLRGIVRELCRYDVAGIHLDYIRYPHDYHAVASQRYPDASDEEISRHSEFSYDPVSLGLLASEFGTDVTREEIIRFRCESVTRVVQELSAVMQQERPANCLLSASVMGNPVEGKYIAYQDSGTWIREGLVDWAVQMNYGTDSFSRYLDEIKLAGGRKGFRNSVVVGIYCKNEVDEILSQIEMVKASGSCGLALFSYGYLFDEDHRTTEKGRIILPEIRPVTKP